MLGRKGEIGLQQILEAVILGQCFFRSGFDSSGSLGLAQYRFFSPALELTILLHVLAKRCVVSVALVDVRLHVVEQIRHLVDPELATEYQVEVHVTLVGGRASFPAPHVPLAYPAQVGMHYVNVLLVDFEGSD